MIIMILKMMAIIAIHIVITLVLWKLFKKNKSMTIAVKILIGVIFGLCAVFSNHFNVNYGHSLLNIRDLSPLVAGLFFDPVSGIIAGFIGGVERFFIGEFFGIGVYTRYACSIATILAGINAAVLSIVVFKRKRPTAIYAFFMGAVTEVLHMYLVLLTHADDMLTALEVVQNNSIPMIFFTALGLMLTSIVITVYAGEWKNPFRKKEPREVGITKRFRFWLFIISIISLTANYLFTYMLQTHASLEHANNAMNEAITAIEAKYNNIPDKENHNNIIIDYNVSDEGSFDIIRDNTVIDGAHNGQRLTDNTLNELNSDDENLIFIDDYFGEDTICHIKKVDNNTIILVSIPSSDVYDMRDTHAYETLFSNIIMLALLYILISMLVQSLIVDDVNKVNHSLRKITNGDLKETVSVYTSSETASLSDDINKMVGTLKGYIQEAEKRNEQELLLSKSIQESALPKNFYENRDDFDIYASMNPTKEVGGDFYDFFFVGPNRLALVIADVSGKGFPAALFMMRAKTAIRTIADQNLSPSEILSETNRTLCEGNGNKMFVTVWIGIIDLSTGIIKCANGGHEYPLLKTADGSYEIYKDNHSAILGLRSKLQYKEYEIKLKSGDAIFVYTDGVPEAINDNEDAYGLERLTNIINDCKNDSSQEMLRKIRQDINDFSGDAEQFDDITMLGFKLT